MAESHYNERHKDFTGFKKNRWTVIRFVRKDRRRIWLCRCACGKEIETTLSHIKNGSSKSCGCHAIDMLRARANPVIKNNPVEYLKWSTAKRRCRPNDPDHAHYYDKGIRFCDKWKDNFAAFFNHMGKCPNGYTLDRIDVTKGYEPGNCRWADWKTQQNNRGNNVRILFRGRMVSTQELREISGLSLRTIGQRIRKGWSDDEIVAPIYSHSSQRKIVRT